MLDKQYEKTFYAIDGAIQNKVGNDANNIEHNTKNKLNEINSRLTDQNAKNYFSEVLLDSNQKAYVTEALYIYYIILRNEFNKSPFVAFILTCCCFYGRIYFSATLPMIEITKDVLRESMISALTSPWKSYGVYLFKSFVYGIGTLGFGIALRKLIEFYYMIKIFYDMSKNDPSLLRPASEGSPTDTVEQIVDRYLENI